MEIKNTMTGRIFSEEEFMKIFPKGSVIDCWGSITEYNTIYELLSDLNDAYYESDEFDSMNLHSELKPKYIII